MYILNIVSVLKKTIRKERNFIYENYYKRVGFNKENTYSLKHQKKDS